MPQVQVIQPIQQQPKRLRVAAYARVSSDSEDQLNSLAVQVDYYSFHEMICLTHRKKFYKKQDSSRRNFPVHRRWNYLTSLSLKSL